MTTDNLLGQIFNSPWSRRLATFTGLVLVVMVSHGLAQLTWLLVPAPQPNVPPMERAVASPQIAQPAPEESTESLASLHLFGKLRQEVAVVPPSTPRDAPETKLQLVLSGVVASDNQQKARAFIVPPNGEELPYSLGAKLPGNAQLAEIHADRVILLRNDRYETLYLQKLDE